MSAFCARTLSPPSPTTYSFSFSRGHKRGLCLPFRTVAVGVVVTRASAKNENDAENNAASTKKPPPKPLPPHVVLNVSASASASTARRAWRRKALQVHPDVAGPSGERALLELNEAYAAFLRSRGVRSRGAVGRGEEEEEAAAAAADESNDDDESDDDDDPFLPPVFFSDDDDDDEEEAIPTVLFVDPFSIEGFDPFRFRELQDLASREKTTSKATTADDTAADVALSALSAAGVARLPARSGVALVTRRQAEALCDVVERSLETLDFASAAYEVSTLLSRARVANASPPRRRRKVRREEEEDL